jgi:hypothetical protein
VLLPFSMRARAWEPHGIALRKRLNLSAHHLLDPFKLAPLIGLRLLDLDDECGRLPKACRQQLLVHGKRQWSGGVYAQPLPDGSRICILNSRHDPRRIKITLMEEVAHIYLKHSPTGLTRSMDGLRMRGYDKKQELEAYGVGAAALLPWAAIFPAVNRGMTIDELAEQFEVSSQLIDYRIKITGAHTLYKARQRPRS